MEEGTLQMMINCNVTNGNDGLNLQEQRATTIFDLVFWFISLLSLLKRRLYLTCARLSFQITYEFVKNFSSIFFYKKYLFHSKKMIFMWLSKMTHLKHQYTRQSDFSLTQAGLLFLNCSIYYFYVFLDSRDEGIFFSSTYCMYLELTQKKNLITYKLIYTNFSFLKNVHVFYDFCLVYPM